MGTEILKSFGTLESELEQAKNSLKGVDENLKRLLGRDPSEIGLGGPRPGIKRPPNNNNEDAKPKWGMAGSRKVYSHDNGEPPTKRRGSVFNRLSDRVPDRSVHYDEELFNDGKPNRLISKVIVTPKEVPSRQEALVAQSGDERFKARNRRMFGALLGTLQKFQQEETKLKSKEQKRADLEKKIEESEIREKAEIKKEKQELFMNRKKKQAEIKMIELKMQKMRTYSQWEELQKPRMCFIQTKAKPSIYYLPRKLNEANKVAQEETRNEIQKLIDERRQEVCEEIKILEERMKWNGKRGKVEKENEVQQEADEAMKEDEDHEAESEKQQQESNSISMEVDTEPLELNNLHQEAKEVEEKENKVIAQSDIETEEDSKKQLQQHSVVESEETANNNDTETNVINSTLTLNAVEDEEKH